MSMQIHMPLAAWNTLLHHLFQDRREQAAFAFSREVEEHGERQLICDDLYLAGEADFEVRARDYILLADDALARLIKSAWDRQRCIVEFHSHPMSSDLVGFSPSDLDGLSEIVPYVRWRLRGRPYAAVVVGRTGIDAMAWTQDGAAPQRVDALMVGGQALRPSQIGHEAWGVKDGKV